MVCGIYFLPPKWEMYWKLFNHEAFVVHIITIGKNNQHYMIIHACFMFEPFSLYKLTFFTIVNNSWGKGVCFHDFCCMSICSTYCHLISRGKGVTKGWSIQLWLGGDLLMIYVYYLVWNLRWNAMCLPMSTFIITMNLGQWLMWVITKHETRLWPNLDR
jgi:hypothetical protein